jgi:starch-binding outer membrane protein, SusD/RagB family
MMTHIGPRLRLALASALVLALGACKGLFDVVAPGRIADDDLNSADAAAGIVTGMSYDLAGAMNSANDLIALASGELWHGGSYNWGDVPRGIIMPEDVNGTWGSMMQARWVSEHGLLRLENSLKPDVFSSSPLTARAYLLGGFANRLIGENVCETVVDGGAPEPNTVEFDRGIAAFGKAITIGSAAGSNGADIVTAAYGGRASLKAWKGDWAGAVADAMHVPVAFAYSAILMTDGLSNTLAYETHDRFEYTVHGTEFANHPGDTRAPWEIIHRADGTVATGANGQSPMYQQEKYVEHGADIPLVKGTEMLVLRAEAALRSNDIATAYGRLNEARAFYGMAALPVAANMTDAWTDLHFERGATTWLENRRFWDERRWFAETGPAHFDFLVDRDRCIPISKTERDSNPNVPKG